MDFNRAGNENHEIDRQEYNEFHKKRKVEVTLQPGDNLKVEPGSKEMFTAIAQPQYHRKKPIPFEKEIPQRDYLFKMMTLKPLEADIFSRLIATRSLTTNICLLAPFPKSRKAKLYAALKGLKDKDLVVKIEKGKFLINPWAILPPPGYRVSARAAWDNLSSPTS
jgi:hypothetical protein